MIICLSTCYTFLISLIPGVITLLIFPFVFSVHHLLISAVVSIAFEKSFVVVSERKYVFVISLNCSLIVTSLLAQILFATLKVTSFKFCAKTINLLIIISK